MERIVSMISIIDNCLLVVKDKEKDFWTLPSGKVEKGENDIKVLKREISKEFPYIKVDTEFTFYKNFIGITPNKGEKAIVLTYMVNVLEDNIVAGAERIPFNYLKKLNLTSITVDVIFCLLFDNLL